MRMGTNKVLLKCLTTWSRNVIRYKNFTAVPVQFSVLIVIIDTLTGVGLTLPFISGNSCINSNFNKDYNCTNNKSVV